MRIRNINVRSYRSLVLCYVPRSFSFEVSFLTHSTMKKKYFARKGNKAQKPTTPFEGKIKQLKKETLILVNLDEAKPFVQECFKQHIKVDVASKAYNGGVFVYLDK